MNKDLAEKFNVEQQMHYDFANQLLSFGIIYRAENSFSWIKDTVRLIIRILIIHSKILLTHLSIYSMDIYGSYLFGF